MVEKATKHDLKILLRTIFICYDFEPNGSGENIAGFDDYMCSRIYNTYLEKK